MKLLSAVLDRTKGDLALSIHTDESRTINDPSWIRPTIPDPGFVAPEDDPDAVAPHVPDVSIQHPQVPDPEVVLSQTYGAGPKRANETVAQYDARLAAHVESSIREATLLAEHEVKRRQKPEDAAKDEARPEVVALIPEPVDLALATAVAKSNIGAKVVAVEEKV